MGEQTENPIPGAASEPEIKAAEPTKATEEATTEAAKEGGDAPETGETGETPVADANPTTDDTSTNPVV